MLIVRYNGASEFVTVPLAYSVRTVFYRDRDLYRTVFSLTVRSVKRSLFSI